MIPLDSEATQIRDEDER